MRDVVPWELAGQAIMSMPFSKATPISELDTTVPMLPGAFPPLSPYGDGYPLQRGLRSILRGQLAARRGALPDPLLCASTTLTSARSCWYARLIELEASVDPLGRLISSSTSRTTTNGEKEASRSRDVPTWPIRTSTRGTSHRGNQASPRNTVCHIACTREKSPTHGLLVSTSTPSPLLKQPFLGTSLSEVRGFSAAAIAHAELSYRLFCQSCSAARIPRSQKSTPTPLDLSLYKCSR